MEKSSPLSALLKDYNIDFSQEELEKIISTELEKEENERNSELIELCRERIEKANETPATKKSFPVRLIILIITAAALVFAFVPSFLKIVKAESPAPSSQHISTETTVTTTTPPTDPVSDPTKASTTGVPDVFINFLYKPEKIIFYHNGKPQTLTEEMCNDVIEEINKATRNAKWGVLKLAVFNEDIDKIKEENYCIEIYYDINSDGTQILNNLNGAGIRDMTFRFEKVFIPLNGNDEGIMFFEKDGIYRNGPIKTFGYNLSEEILKDILDEWVTRP